MDNNKSTRYQFNLYSLTNSEEFEDQFSINPDQASTKYNIEIQPKEDHFSLIGSKSDILKFLTFADSTQMSPGESVEDWKPLIKKIK